MSRFRALHATLLYKQFLQTSIWRACRLVSKHFLRICGQVFSAVGASPREFSPNVFWYERALCLTLRLLQTRPKNRAELMSVALILNVVGVAHMYINCELEQFPSPPNHLSSAQPQLRRNHLPSKRLLPYLEKSVAYH